MCWTSKVPLFPPFFLIPITWSIFIPWPRLTVGLRGGPWHGDEIGRSFGSGGPYRGLGPGGESVTVVTDSRAERERSVSSTSGRPHLAGLCEGERGPLEHCCRRITGCWHFLKNLSKRQASGGSCSALYCTTQGSAWACHRFRSAGSYEVRDWVRSRYRIYRMMLDVKVGICLGIKCRVPGPFWCWSTNPWCHRFMQWIPAWKSTGTGPVQVASGSLEFFADLFQVATVCLMGLIRQIDHD